MSKPSRSYFISQILYHREQTSKPVLRVAPKRHPPSAQSYIAQAEPLGKKRACKAAGVICQGFKTEPIPAMPCMIGEKAWERGEELFQVCGTTFRGRGPCRLEVIVGSTFSRGGIGEKEEDADKGGFGHYEGCEAGIKYVGTSKYLDLLPLAIHPLTGGAPRVPGASIMLSLFGCPSIVTLLSSILFQVIQCAPAATLLPSRPIYSLPPLQPSLPLNDSSNGYCASTARYPSWISDDWIVEDCFVAVQKLYFEEFLVHPDVAYEFLARGVSPTGFPRGSERTPRKYIVSKSIRGWMLAVVRGRG